MRGGLRETASPHPVADRARDPACEVTGAVDEGVVDAHEESDRAAAHPGNDLGEADERPAGRVADGASNGMDARHEMLGFFSCWPSCGPTP